MTEAGTLLTDDEISYLSAFLAAGYGVGGLGATVELRWGYRSPDGVTSWCPGGEPEARTLSAAYAGRPAGTLLRQTIISFQPQEIPTTQPGRTDDAGTD